MSTNSLEHLSDDVRQFRDLYERELHDGLAQQIPYAQLLLRDVLFRSQEQELRSPRDIEQIKAAIFLLREASNEIQYLFSLLRVPLEEGNFFESVKRYVDSVAMAVDISIAFVGEGDDKIVPAAVQHDVTMILLEALSNSIRHGKASNIDVACVIQPTRLTLVIKDNGEGMSSTGLSSGSGLQNMRWRAERWNGQVTLLPNKPAGVVLEAEFLIPTDSSASDGLHPHL